MHPSVLFITVCEHASPRGVSLIINDIRRYRRPGTYSVSGPASGSHSLHFIFLRRKTIRGLGRSHSTVATSTSSLHETKVVRLELLAME